MASGLSGSVLRVIRSPHFWAVAVMFAIGIILHYPQQILSIESPSLFSSLGLTRYAVERIFLLVPIGYAGFFLGIKAGLASSAIALAIMLPRIFLISLYPEDALFETGGVILIGGLVNLWFYMHRKDKAQRKIAEEMLVKIIDGSPIPSFVINKQHQVTLWNAAIESLSGIKREAIIRTTEQWRAFYAETRPVMADLIVDGASANEIETYYGDKCNKSLLIDGAYEAEDFSPALGNNGKWLHFTASPIRDNNGEIIGAIETLGDITERKTAEEALLKSEKSFRDLFESAFDAIWVHDLEGNIQVANEAAAKLVGYTVEELYQANIRLFLTEESLKLAREIKVKLIQYQPVALPYEQRVIRKDGREAICMIATNLIISDGKPKAFQNIARDVTEEKRMHENLRYYLREITRVQEEERKRIARELHDGTAQNLIALLRQLENLLSDKTKLPMREAKALWSLHEQIRDVLQEVRQFSRDLRPSILDDLGLLPALEWITEELKGNYGLETSLKVVGSERRLPQEAELLLFRIVQEALSNTAKHAQASKAKVKVEFDQDKIKVTISDNGIGFQLPESLGTLPYAGKLGLVGMQERVQLLRGSLKIESELGKGTTVSVEVPV